MYFGKIECASQPPITTRIPNPVRMKKASRSPWLFDPVLDTQK
jgi:hypothetical protein